MPPTIQNDSLLDLIRARRTTYKFLSKDTHSVSQTAIKNCLEAAIWAPNHKLTQPWRFWELGPQAQQVFAEIYAENRAQKKAKNCPEQKSKCYQDALQKFMNIPKVILIGQTLHRDKIIQKEDYAACACAVQNFQLMAWQQNYGVQWSTGPIIDDSRSYQFLKIDSQTTQLIGALYMGQPDPDNLPKAPKRKPVEGISESLA